MSALHRFHHHFLPHFIVAPELAGAFGGHNKIHHRAHALSHFWLFSYLQVLLVAFVALYLVQTRAPQILGEVTFSAQEIISLTNAKRAENGLGALSFNPLLASAASLKAQDMFAKDYWAHNSPSGNTPWEFFSRAGYKYVFAGENLARDFNDPGSVVDAWMNSPSHRANILDKNFKEIGIAVSSGKLTGKEGILVVQMFGSQVAQAQQAGVSDSENTLQSEPEDKQIAVVSPKPSVVVSPSPVPSESPIAIAYDSGGTFEQEQFATVLASKQFSVAKGASLALVGFIFVLFMLEVVVTFKRAHVTIRPQVVAHLLVLGFLLFAVWYAVGGTVI